MHHVTCIRIVLLSISYYGIMQTNKCISTPLPHCHRWLSLQLYLSAKNLSECAKQNLDAVSTPMVEKLSLLKTNVRAKRLLVPSENSPT